MENPNPSVKNFCVLARLFKDKSDGIHIFPKLPTMLKSYFTTWEKDAGIKSTSQSLDPSVAALLTELFNTRISSNNGEILPVTQTILHQENTDMDVNVDTLRFHAGINDEEDQPSKEQHPIINVPPIQAVSQIHYIPTHNPIEAIPLDNTRCAWYSKCCRPRVVCMGVKKSTCQFLKHRADDREFVMQKLADQAELKRQTSGRSWKKMW